MTEQGAITEQQPELAQQISECRERGNDLYRQQNFEKAVEVYSEGLNLDSHSIPLLVNRALAEIKLHKFTNAVRDCTDALFLDRTNVKALVRRAMAWRGKHKPQFALDDLKQASKQAPNNMEIQRLLRTVEQEIANQQQEEETVKQLLVNETPETKILRELQEELPQMSGKHLRRGLWAACDLLSTDKNRIFFRAINGLQTLQRCFDKCPFGSLTTLTAAAQDASSAAQVATVMNFQSLLNILRKERCTVEGDGDQIVACARLMNVCCSKEAFRQQLSMQMSLQLVQSLLCLVRRNTPTLCGEIDKKAGAFPATSSPSPVSTFQSSLFSNQYSSASHTSSAMHSFLSSSSASASGSSSSSSSSQPLSSASQSQLSFLFRCPVNMYGSPTFSFAAVPFALSALVSLSADSNFSLAFLNCVKADSSSSPSLKSATSTSSDSDSSSNASSTTTSSANSTSLTTTSQQPSPSIVTILAPLLQSRSFILSLLTSSLFLHLSKDPQFRPEILRIAPSMLSFLSNGLNQLMSIISFVKENAMMNPFSTSTPSNFSPSQLPSSTSSFSNASSSSGSFSSPSPNSMGFGSGPTGSVTPRGVQIRSHPASSAVASHIDALSSVYGTPGSNQGKGADRRPSPGIRHASVGGGASVPPRPSSASSAYGGSQTGAGTLLVASTCAAFEHRASTTGLVWTHVSAAVPSCWEEEMDRCGWRDTSTHKEERVVAAADGGFSIWQLMNAAEQGEFAERSTSICNIMAALGNTALLQSSLPKLHQLGILNAMMPALVSPTFIPQIHPAPNTAQPNSTSSPGSAAGTAFVPTILPYAVSSSALALLARLAGHPPVAEEMPVALLPVLLHGLTSPPPTRAHSAHIIALFTRHVQAGILPLIRFPTAFSRLSQVVREGKDDEAGNAAVALAECAKEKESYSILRESGCLESLVHSMQTRSGHTQRNAAIALARASQDPLNLQRVRTLHGIELMHMVKTTEQT
ncbi:putative TPR repeat containing protein [Monocercomonoides exilis]|uniref:putative TPR repeat containing protein n=1 Tax=Monocercomonoides exilis TaxID=2049356 RepID=UPI0035596064|nr:putative TPR repeat containing protein [Monocercomonoides exilis]|eukprot:MONOS_8513.1-p1 / transcript=MONOS_8513.1 / gene=MONOS_8513 / organism=Monocercomonoides_exilis_PA203 / gene_product=TPR repeat containing protein / transcript_product=TPR repeat containing protein / location=Mono_scaffold00323:4917-8009(-) / protein_length=981 / sequence_SO=supercontig / SO=protein_coding / is_pseudo=false